MSVQQELGRTRQEIKDVKELALLKDLIIVHCYQVDNEWQSIVTETEYGDAQVDKADKNSQRLETYDAMRKTTESEREAEDQIMEQVNKYTRNGGRRYCRVFTWLSEIESVESKVETEMLSVKMHLTKMTLLRSLSAMMPRRHLLKPHNCSRVYQNNRASHS